MRQKLGSYRRLALSSATALACLGLVLFSPLVESVPRASAATETVVTAASSTPNLPAAPSTVNTVNPMSTASWDVHDPDGYLKDPASADQNMTICSSEKTHCKFAIVQSFTGGDVSSAAIKFAETNGLGSEDLMLFIGVEKRKYTYILGSDVSLRSSLKQELDSQTAPILKQAIESGDWDTAVKEAGTLMGTTLLESGTSSNSSSTPGSVHPKSNIEDTVEGLIALIFIFIMFALPVYFIVKFVKMIKRRRRWREQWVAEEALAAQNRNPATPNPTEQWASLDTKTLAERANTGLLNVDNGLRDAEDELEFARIQFGRSDTDQFDSIIAQSKPRITQAWKLLSQSHSESDEQKRRGLYLDILQLVTEVDREIGAQRGSFEKLRTQVKEVPNEIPAMRDRLAELLAEEATWALELSALRASFPTTQLDSLEAIPQRIKSLIESSEIALKEAERALANGNGSQSQHRLQLAQRTYTQAVQLRKQLGEANITLSQASDLLVRAVASISSDLQDMTRLGVGDATVGGFAKEARKAVDQANRARAGEADPIAALEKLSEAERALDTILVPYRGAEEAKKREITRVSLRLADVQATVDRARSYVQLNRGVAPAEARMELASAEDKIAQSAKMLETSPALAENLIEEAGRHANQVMKLVYGLIATHRSNPGNQPTDLLTGLILGGIMNGGSRHTWGSSQTSWGSGSIFDSSDSSSSFSSFGGGGFSFGGGGFSSTGGSSF
ncbi:TPM domain-containing protein [Boudabousia marimammalium]|uniref:TPM domain-containing protein n=1 Tax=Boudabousia marimammalium TaxID=156892 RepID=A0A1Q5PL67_9ACTO|nr:TPM domain-containing protein [Boudabousia marimammalium]OKL47388.1 hypothetical protein BM477_06900 [Boudabousia marimammalium]